MGKKGFTLAEVLVTIMIVGVLCVLLIPMLMQHTAQQEHITVFKKAVSMVGQAIEKNYALDGEDASCFTGGNFIHLLTKRLNVMSSGGNVIYTADGIKLTVQEAGGECTTDGPGANIPCAYIDVDTNGKKGPNMVTTAATAVYDQFTIAVYPRRAEPATEEQKEVMYKTGRSRNR